MGYTQNWSGSTKCSKLDWDKVKGDLLYLVDEAGIPLAGSDGTGLALIGEEIRFNGSGNRDSYETFYVKHNRNEGGYCKTAQKPYDIIVCCALMIVRHYIPSFTVQSDGDAEDWAEAVALCRRVLKYGVYPCDGAVDTPEAVVHTHESPKTVQPVADVIEIHRTAITEL